MITAAPTPRTAQSSGLRSTRIRSGLTRQPALVTGARKAQAEAGHPVHGRSFFAPLPEPLPAIQDLDPLIQAVTWEESDDESAKEPEPDFLPGGNGGDATRLLGMPGLQGTTLLMSRLYTGLCSSCAMLQRLSRAAATVSMQQRLLLEAAVVLQQAQRLELAAGLLGITLQSGDCGLITSSLAGLDDLARMRGQMKSIDVRIARGLIGLASMEVDILHAIMRWAREHQCNTVHRLMEKCRQEKLALLESMVRLNARKVLERDASADSALAAA